MNRPSLLVFFLLLGWAPSALATSAAKVAILEIDINNGEIVMSAQKVDLKKLKKGEIEAPKKGEKITGAEFQKLMAERMRENGGRPMRIIRN